jgi:hypothetical protein
LLRVIAKAVNLALVAVLIKSIPRGSCPSGLVHLLLSNDLSVVKTMATVSITRGDGLVLILVPVIAWGLRPPPLLRLCVFLTPGRSWASVIVPLEG